MRIQKQLSRVTTTYLRRYYEILDDMIAEMSGAELTDSISHNFILQMIPHHRAAIAMSENILRYTTCLPIESIAGKIIAEQEQSIADMRACFEKCSQQKNSDDALCLYGRQFRKISETMFRQMQTAPAVNDINLNFLREMLPHHEGAVRMCRNALQFDLCPELLPILEAILRTQSRGIRQMRELLQRLS